MELKTVVKNAEIFQNVRDSDGFCPCAVVRSPDTRCPCLAFRMQSSPGVCHCGLYEKVAAGNRYESWLDSYLDECEREGEDSP